MASEADPAGHWEGVWREVLHAGAGDATAPEKRKGRADPAFASFPKGPGISAC